MLAGLLSARPVLSSALDAGQSTQGGSTALSVSLPVGQSKLEVTFGAGGFDLSQEVLIGWIHNAASAVAHYYGAFPVPLMRLRVNSSETRTGVFRGTTWGGSPPFTRIFVGKHTSEEQLRDDWMLTHEFVHLGFPNMADEHHWIEEGIATYVEPIARVQVGQLTARKIWADMVRDMPKGEPLPSDQGLDHTHTWGRTYWGGALFCLVADVRIRQASQNRSGLQEALRGIVHAGGTIDQSWPLERALEIGDQATQTKVLTTIYNEMKDKPVHVDLDLLWRNLGITDLSQPVTFNDRASLADIRRAITAPQPL